MGEGAGDRIHQQAWSWRGRSIVLGLLRVKESAGRRGVRGSTRLPDKDVRVCGPRTPKRAPERGAGRRVVPGALLYFAHATCKITEHFFWRARRDATWRLVS